MAADGPFDLVLLLETLHNMSRTTRSSRSIAGCARARRLDPYR